jgi:hypothetical protein
VQEVQRREKLAERKESGEQRAERESRESTEREQREQRAERSRAERAGDAVEVRGAMGLALTTNQKFYRQNRISGLQRQRRNFTCVF